jgi:hypothetical protein
MLYEYKFLISLLLTIIVEIISLFILIKFFFKKEKIKNQILFFAGFLCSFATLPYLWFIIPLLVKTRLPYILIGEIFVVLIESFIIFFMLKINYKKSIIISFICNIISFLLGLLLLNL